MSVIKHKEQRVAVLIDAQNLYHSARKIYNRKVNFGNVVEAGVAGRALVRALAYVITSETGEESAFFDALEKIGIEIKTKDLQVFAGGAKKADWDVGLAVDAISISDKVDNVIIVSGDGDFVPLVEYLQTAKGCQVEVISFGRSSSSRLVDAADDFIDLDEDPQKYLIGYRKQRRARKTSGSKDAASKSTQKRGRKSKTSK